MAAVWKSIEFSIFKKKKYEDFKKSVSSKIKNGVSKFETDSLKIFVWESVHRFKKRI